MVSKLLHGKMGNVVVTIALIVTLVLVIGFGSGCQSDLVGPSSSWKVLYKGENNNKEYLSRGAGMSSQTGWTAGNPDCIN
jgi:hypothetical protein